MTRIYSRIQMLSAGVGDALCAPFLPSAFSLQPSALTVLIHVIHKSAVKSDPTDSESQSQAFASRADKSSSSPRPRVPTDLEPSEYRNQPPADAWQNSVEAYDTSPAGPTAPGSPPLSSRVAPSFLRH